MPAPIDTQQKCPQCESELPLDALVCPSCHTILVNNTTKKATPPWVIALLITVIALLFVYAAYLGYQVFIKHNY